MIDFLPKFDINKDTSADKIFDTWDSILTGYKSEEFTGQLSLIQEKHITLGEYDFGFAKIPMRILITTNVAKDWYNNPHTFISEYKDWKNVCPSMIQKDDVVFDCGAHHGIYSIFFANQVGDKGKVIAFELVPINSDLARLNADMNGMENIEVVEAGVSSRHMTINASPKAHSVNVSHESDSVSMQLVTLDEYAELNPTLIKLDIEGSEVDALMGASELLKRKLRWVISVHPKFIKQQGHNPKEIFDYLSLDDYICYILYPNKQHGLYNGEYDLEDFCELMFFPK